MSKYYRKFIFTVIMTSVSMLQLNCPNIPTVSEAKASTSATPGIQNVAITGALDTTNFGTSGIVLNSLLNTNNIAYAVAVQSDGKIVVAGGSNGLSLDMAIWRYNTNGALDATFGTNGMVTFVGGGNATAKGIAIQADGKIVVTGYSSNAARNKDMIVWRYNTDGTLDTANFGALNGFVVHDSAAGGRVNDGGNAVAIQADGKIVVTGYSDNAARDTDMVIWRYNTDGTLDTTFNNPTGFSVHLGAAGGNGNDAGNGIAFQANGDILVTGYSTNRTPDLDMVIWNYASNGIFRSSVRRDNVAGGRTAPLHDAGNSIAIQSDGKIIVTGYSTGASGNDMVIWRYNADLTLDTTFNATGFVVHNNAASGNGNDMGNALALQSDGKIVVAGYSTNLTPNQDMTIWRYNTDGTLDATFNTTGFVVHDNAAGGSGNDAGNAVSIQADGKIVIAGFSTNLTPNQDMAIWRYK